VSDSTGDVFWGLPDELLLRAHDALGRRARYWRNELGLGLASAVLLELAWSGRIGFDPGAVPGRVLLRDLTKAVDPVADMLLQLIALARRARSAEHWIGSTGRTVLIEVQTRIVSQGTVQPAPCCRLPDREEAALRALLGAMTGKAARTEQEDPATELVSSALRLAVTGAKSQICLP
jgi:hypothetical protein